MAKFIEVTRIFDFGASYERTNKMLIKTDSLISIEYSDNATLLTYECDSFFISESYDEVKNKLEVVND